MTSAHIKGIGELNRAELFLPTSKPYEYYATIDQCGPERLLFREIAALFQTVVQIAVPLHNLK